MNERKAKSFWIALFLLVACSGKEEKISVVVDDPTEIVERCTAIDFGKPARCPVGFVCLPKNKGLVLSGGECAPAWYFAIKSEAGVSDISCLDEEGQEVFKYTEATRSRWYWCGSNGATQAVTYVPSESPGAFRLRVITWGFTEQICPQEEVTGFCNPALLIVGLHN
jgi:hypothetical protein